MFSNFNGKFIDFYAIYNFYILQIVLSIGWIIFR